MRIERMCIVIDTNQLGTYLGGKNPNYRPIENWVENRKGKIAYCPVDPIKREMERYIENMTELARERKRSNVIKQIESDAYFNELNILDKKSSKKNYPKIQSDDKHIIALALAAKVNVLVTQDDDLSEDFKKHVKNGKIYKYESHEHLLPRDGCP